VKTSSSATVSWVCLNNHRRAPEKCDAQEFRFHDVGSFRVPE